MRPAWPTKQNREETVVKQHIRATSRRRPVLATDSKIVLPPCQRLAYDIANGILALLGKPPLVIIQ